MHFMKNLTVYTLNSHLLTLKAHTHKMYVFVFFAFQGFDFLHPVLLEEAMGIHK